MRPAAKCAIVNIKLREARDIRPTPDDEQLNAFQHQPFTIRGSGRLFFSPKDRITQSYESDNEDTYLDQIRICNVHWQPSFLSSGGLPLRRGQAALVCSDFP